MTFQTLLEVYYDEKPGLYNHFQAGIKVNFWKYDFDWPRRHDANLKNYQQSSSILNHILTPYYLLLSFIASQRYNRLADACENLIKTSIVADIERQNYDVFFNEQLTLCGFGIGHFAEIKINVWVSSCPLNSAMSSILGLPSAASWLPATFDNLNTNDIMSFTDRYYNMLSGFITIRGFQQLVEAESEVFRKLLKAFSMFEEYFFIVRLGSDSEIVPTNPNYNNIYFVEWVVQHKLLCNKNVKLFITHGGYNSILEAVDCAVPLVVIPLFGDQMFNGKLVEKQGFGKVISQNAIFANPMIIKDVIHEVLDNEKSW
ncbi:unnamed protein product [Bursaphelenchus okinawaensis]|uniref:UDP-glucuronosyltransferase n=1 Tax=Bursaphelenchus okinawaensis TaxID=465554 RepID=A0A811L666_9BILA|nr:unnamed protein product [Bursaphelenchus okinawaensis]CAG9117361.1 unnamed protein product [Bursaphelenchus okinawaensis]